MRSEELRARLSRLRPRDIEVAKALVQCPSLSVPEVAGRLSMSFENAKDRSSRIYAVLGVSNRLELYAFYHRLLLDQSCC